MFTSSISSFISVRTWAWIVMSSALVGSSAISKVGFSLRAIAIMIRWRMPPDSSCGYRSRIVSGSLIRTRRRYSRASLRSSSEVRPARGRRPSGAEGRNVRPIASFGSTGRSFE